MPPQKNIKNYQAQGLLGRNCNVGKVWLIHEDRAISGEELTRLSLLSDLEMCCNIVHGCCALRFDDFFEFSTNPVTRGHSLKLIVTLSKSNIRINFFAVRVVPIWNSLLPCKIPCKNHGHGRSPTACDWLYLVLQFPRPTSVEPPSFHCLRAGC